MSDDFNFTVSRGALALGLDSRTLAKRIKAVNLKPCAKNGGFDAYFLGDLAKAAYAVIESEDSDRKYNVEDLSPKDLNHHYAALKKQRELRRLDGELVDYSEAADKFAELAKTFGGFFPLFIDDLEQTQKFTVAQLVDIQDFCDAKRREFFIAEF